MVCENTLDASSISLEYVYEAFIVKPRDNRFSSFSPTALKVELPTLSLNSATVVKRGKGRNNCCCVIVAVPRDEEAGIEPKKGFGTRANSAPPRDKYCVGS